LELEAVAVRAVRLEDERADRALRLARVALADAVEDARPVGVLEAGEAEGLVEAAVAIDGQVGAEDDAGAAAEVAEGGVRIVRPGAGEEALAPLAGRERLRPH